MQSEGYNTETSPWCNSFHSKLFPYNGKSGVTLNIKPWRSMGDWKLYLHAFWTTWEGVVSFTLLSFCLWGKGHLTGGRVGSRSYHNKTHEQKSPLPFWVPSIFALQRNTHTGLPMIRSKQFLLNLLIRQGARGSVVGWGTMLRAGR
jgi:hypothetical protein